MQQNVFRNPSLTQGPVLRMRISCYAHEHLQSSDEGSLPCACAEYRLKSICCRNGTMSTAV